MKDLFMVQLALLILLLSALTATLYFSRDIVSRVKYLSNKKVRYSLILISPLIMIFEGGIINSMTDFASIMTAEDGGEFAKTLQKLGMDDYISSEEIEAQKGKNIIILSLESFERAYLSPKLQHLAPNLVNMKNNWTYFNMVQTPGSGWTSGSLYTSLTGFPAFFNGSANSIFETSYRSFIVSISDVLKKAGYVMTFMTGNAEFSGTEDMLSTFQFDNIIDGRKLKDKYEILHYGFVHDKDLFEEAKLEILRKKEKNMNFALVISTISTHFPNGIYDRRMEKFLPAQEDDLEFMISAVDYMIGDFVRFLEKEDILSNSTVYIYPDHLKMGTSSVFNGTGERGLYVITNAPKNDFYLNDSNNIFQIDLPKMLLQGAGVEHNVKFLTDYISSDKEEFIKENIELITELNSSGLQRAKSSSKYFDKLENTFKYRAKKLAKIKTEHLESVKIDKTRFIAQSGGIVDEHIATNSLEALNNSYNNGFRLIELDILKTSDNKYVSSRDWKQWKEESGYTGSVPVSEKEFLKHRIAKKYTPLNMEAINSWFSSHTDATLVTNKINEPERFAEVFIDRERLMMQLFTLDAVKEGIDAGIKSSMPSQTVISSLGNNRLAILVGLGVKDVVVSQNFILPNITFLDELRGNFIRVYINGGYLDNGMDENYLVNYEMDYIHGIYADKWQFPE